MRIIQNLLDLKNSPVLNVLLSEEAIKEIFGISPISLDEFLNKISLEIDKKMMHYSESEGIESLGGELFLYLNDKNELIAKAELYFKDIDGKIQVKEITNNFGDSALLDMDMKFIKNNSQKYEIEPPSIKKNLY